jgi:cell division protein FtsI (penicillin-binding protein 3)
MSKFSYKEVSPRYTLLAVVFTLLAIVIVAKAGYVMSVERDYWLQVASRVKLDSVEVKPIRGNILSCDGELMASSLPEFKLFVDFNAIRQSENDSLFDSKLDSICLCLNQIFPETSANQFREHLLEGRRVQSRHWPIIKRRVDYSTYKEVKGLPIFNLVSYKGGFHVEEFNARQHPYGSLAGRTVGDMFGGKDTARCGLELSYDSILRGKNGIVHRRKVLNKYLSLTDVAPENGADIVTTIDVGMQDLAERSLIKELELINGNVGVAIVMEVKTGDIKAIVNMEKCEGDKYREIHNHAVSDLLEPGSVFKPLSIMICLDQGKCDTNKIVETGGGVWPMYGRQMKDHNWRRGGYGTMNLPKTLKVSSNIGVSRIVDQYYHNCPEKFVDAVYRTGITDDLEIPLVGSSPARIRRPKKNKRGQWLNWSNTALPWMSIGYETQIPPISTLTFYNAIANGGKMMRPRFVKQVVKDGEVLIDFPPVVMREHIAKPNTIKLMQEMLEKVVSEGLGKKAGSPSFKVAGKTGTAQISQGVGGYKSGTVHYLLSFAGFFPADNPRYSCIVCIQKSGLPASGGGMSGVVFHDIAEGIMAQSLKMDVSDAYDSASILVPDVKKGNLLAADYVLSHLNIPTLGGWNGSYAQGNPIWGVADISNRKTVSLKQEKKYGNSYIPDVTGMGARDAVYVLERRGVRTVIKGCGKVKSQSIAAGTKINRKQVCVLTLE